MSTSPSPVPAPAVSPFYTLLEHLISLAGVLASLRNPAFGPVIGMAADGINAELAHQAAGNPATAASLVENVAPGAMALGASLAAKNNPAHVDAIAATIQAVVTAIPTPSAAKNAATGTPAAQTQ